MDNAAKVMKKSYNQTRKLSKTEEMATHLNDFFHSFGQLWHIASQGSCYFATDSRENRLRILNIQDRLVR